MKLPDVLGAFLAAQNTLTLATTNADGSPHACDLFYVLADDACYFLSDPTTRHVQNLARAPRVSATIHGASQGWQDIRGVQIVGIAARVDARAERTRAFAQYLAKYAFVRETLPNVEMLGRTHEVFGVIDLYKLAPRWIRWIDDTQGFGHKEEFGIPNSKF
jgi:uncharacterized protein YhbP (UPF0306 family)